MENMVNRFKNSDKFTLEAQATSAEEAIKAAVELEDSCLIALEEGDGFFKVVVDDNNFVAVAEKIGYQVFAILEDGDDIGMDIYEVTFIPMN